MVDTPARFVSPPILALCMCETSLILIQQNYYSRTCPSALDRIYRQVTPIRPLIYLRPRSQTMKVAFRYNFRNF